MESKERGYVLADMAQKDESMITNRDLMLPYAVPYLAYVAIASLGQDRLPDMALYSLKLVLVPLLLVWAWKWYGPVTGPKSRVISVFWGVLFGLGGLVIWCLLLVPFVTIAGEPWEFQAFVLRAIAAALIVPIFEEIFIRGYILKGALQWDTHRKKEGYAEALSRTLDSDTIHEVAPGAWSVAAVGISSICFAAGHLPYEWPAALAYSLWMSVLWVFRKDLLSCIIAHSTTNLALAVYVYTTGSWGFW